MTESRDEWIKKRAYSLWEKEGYPTGKEAAHWEQATKEHGVMEKTAPDGLKVKPKAKRAAAPKASPATAAKKSSASAGNGAAPIVAAAASKRTTKKVATVKA